MIYNVPRNAFRVVAFADILGWGELTAGIDQLIARKLFRGETLSTDESAAVDQFQARIELAHALDQRVSQILSELREFAIPDTDVAGEPGPTHFWSNRHVTFTRFSDNVFMHSTSFRWVVQFLSELLKRGLDRGVIFRAGISAGSVFHEEPSLSGLDTRSRDVSLFGDAVTTAVAAERAGKGRGARVLVHHRLQALLTDEDSSILQPIDGSACVDSEIRWWTDFRKTSHASSVNKSIQARETWREEAIERLKTHQDFEWNRISVPGALVVNDTIQALESDLSAPN